MFNACPSGPQLAPEKKEIYIYRHFLLYLHSCLPSYFGFFLFILFMALVFFSPVVISKPCQVCPPPPLKHWRRHKARQAEWRGAGGAECLDSDGLMPSDGRCISFDASASCLSSSCVLSLFPGCFSSSSSFFLPPCALRKWLLYGDLCFMSRASAFSSVLCCFFLLFFFLFFSAPTPSHPLPSLGRGTATRTCKVNMTEVAESLHELSRCFRVYTLVHAGFGTAVYRSC